MTATEAPLGPIRNVDDYLALIRWRPGMVLGRPTLTALNQALNGFRFALECRNAEDLPDWTFFQGFTPFLEEYYGTKNTFGWYGILMNECSGSEEQGLALFFERYDDFRAGHRSENPRAAILRLLRLLVLQPGQARALMGTQTENVLSEFLEQLTFYVLSDKRSDFESLIQVLRQDEETLPAFRAMLQACGYELPQE